MSLRCWCTAARLITLRSTPVRAVREVAQALHDGRGARDPGSLLEAFVDRIVHRFARLVEGLEDAVNEEEDRVARPGLNVDTEPVAEIRRQAITLRRYLAPTRELLHEASRQTPSWLPESLRVRLREDSERVSRLVEALDTVRERAMVCKDELLARTNERIARTSYLFSVIAMIFLPLTFVTGLLGMNVGGIPWAETAEGFALVCGGLLGLGLILTVMARLTRWL